MPNLSMNHAAHKAGIYFDAISKVAVVVVGGFCSVITFQFQAAIKDVRQHAVSIARIESNRYTSQDGLADQRLIMSELHKLREWVERNYPPPSLLQSIEEMKTRDREMARDLRDIRADVHKIQVSLGVDE